MIDFFCESDEVKREKKNTVSIHVVESFTGDIIAWAQWKHPFLIVSLQTVDESCIIK